MLKLLRHFFSDIKTDLFHSSLLLSGSLVAQLIAFAAYPVITRLYSPSQFGEFSVFLSITGILTIIATGRFEYALMLPEDEIEAKTLKNIGLRWCLLFSISCFLVSIVLGFFKKVSIPGLYLIGLYVFLSGAIQLFTLYRNRLKQYKKLAQVAIMQNAAASGSKVLLGFGGLLNVGLLWGSLFGQLVSFWVVSKGFLKDVMSAKPENAGQTLQKYAAFPKYRMVQALMNYFSSNLPIFFITIYFSVKEAGYYALVFGVALKIINLFSTSFYQVFFKRFGEIDVSERLALFRKYMLFLLVLCSLPALITFSFSDILITKCFGNEWLPSSTYFRLILPWLFTVFISSPFYFVPDIYSLQQKAIKFEFIYLFFRILALFTGFFFHSILLSLSLYALTGFLYNALLILWYTLILKNHA